MAAFLGIKKTFFRQINDIQVKIMWFKQKEKAGVNSDDAKDPP
ncbi:hypothetical protein R2X38_11925 [Photobacterium rosenbergii]|uniref:Uncharacterized protein n=1 Tax=Photobacterium rosenbergii TaxID=294936 RepID=A0ABU3ZHW8_9GAMM|nr:hypothetical protein [Photobacterium rosenbergii]